MNFLRKKNDNHPEFWLEYLTLFTRKKQETTLKNIRFVAFDTETTGFDYDSDRILSIGAVGIKNTVINVSDQLELYLKQEIFNSETVEIHGIIKKGNVDKVSEPMALQLFVEYIKDAVLVAHHASFDIQMINKALQRNGFGKLKNKVLDTGILFKNTKHLIYRNDVNKIYSLDELSKDLKISQSDRHTASGDAFITALAFLKIISKLKKDKEINQDDLFRLK